MIRPRALQATLGLLLAPLAAHACPEQSLSCIPRFHLAINQESGGSFVVTRGESATTVLGLGLGADFFPIDNLSVGARGGVRADHSDRPRYQGGRAEWSVAWDVGVRAGYNVPLSRRWSLWPRMGLGFDNAPRVVAFAQSRTPTLATVRYSTLSVDVFVPVVVHPNRHFFVGFGPRASLAIYAHATDIINPLSTSTFGAQLLVGGHF